MITGDAIMETVVFTGTPTGLGKHVNGYTVGTYPGYNLNNSWNVRSTGIPTETDASDAGDYTFDYTVFQGVTIAFSGPAKEPTAIIKVAGVVEQQIYFDF